MTITMHILILLGMILGQGLRADPSADYVRNNAIVLASRSEINQRVASELDSYKVITLGEMHGSNESPEIFLSLVKWFADRGEKLLVGLEIPQRDQQAIDNFIHTGNVADLRKSPFFNSDRHDGRSSKAMIQLLLKLGQLQNVKVLCFDAPGATGQIRDEGMAKNISDAYKQGNFDRVLIYAGNIHARVEKGYPRFPDYRPMAYELHARAGAVFQKSDIYAANVIFYGGEVWACIDDVCGVQKQGPIPSVYSDAIPDSFYFLNEPVLNLGYRGTFFQRTLTASFPFEHPCRVTSKLIDENLNKTWREFDQTLGKGWRALGDFKCYAEAAQLIDTYVLKHFNDLTEGERLVSFWHTGQLFAFESQNGLARNRFSSALNPNEDPADTLKWNAYVRATIAYVDQDIKELRVQRVKVAKSQDSGNLMNLGIVDNLIKCFFYPYSVAYSGQCGP